MSLLLLGGEFSALLSLPRFLGILSPPELLNFGQFSFCTPSENRVIGSRQVYHYDPRATRCLLQSIRDLSLSALVFIIDSLNYLLSNMR